MDNITAAMIESLNVLVSFFPNVNVDTQSNISTWVTAIQQGISSANAIIPVPLFLFYINAILIIEAGLLTWRIYRWAANNISLGILK